MMKASAESLRSTNHVGTKGNSRKAEAGGLGWRINRETQASLNAAKKSSNRTQGMWRLGAWNVVLKFSLSESPGVPGPRAGAHTAEDKPN